MLLILFQRNPTHIHAKMAVLKVRLGSVCKKYLKVFPPLCMLCDTASEKIRIKT